MRMMTVLGLALSAMTSPALADQIILTDQQLDTVTAGGANFVLTPGQPEGRLRFNEGQAEAGMQVFPELKDLEGFNFVLAPGQPETGKLLINQGQVQRSTIISVP